MSAVAALPEGGDDAVRGDAGVLYEPATAATDGAAKFERNESSPGSPRNRGLHVGSPCPTAAERRVSLGPLLASPRRSGHAARGGAATRAGFRDSADGLHGG
jgi:hypothetical protein